MKEKVKEYTKKVLKTLLNTVRVAAFLLVVVILLGIWHSWFRPKNYDGGLMMETFYEQPENSIDVLCIGSSHTFVDINTGVLWNEQGIASYVLGGSMQPFWNSYYYLKEAVKTQTPSLVILEALACNMPDDYSDHGMIVNNVSGMRWSMNKLEAIRASVCDTDGVIDYTLLFEEYHERYSELNITDIAEELGDTVRTENWKGFYDYFRIDPINEPIFDEDVDPVPITNKQEYYYRKIIEFCEEAGIPLLVIVSPDGGYNTDARAYYRYAAEVAEEYGVDFVDFNEYYDEMDLDFSCDFGDIGHLNYSGNRKFTSVLGDYLDENFDLPDRSGDTSGLYDSWELNYIYTEARADNYRLRTTFDAEEYFEKLGELSDDYEIFIQISDITYITEESRRYLGYNGISCARPFDNHWYLINNHRTTPMTADEDGMYYEEFTGQHHLSVSNAGIWLDGWNAVDPDHEGVVIITYDTYNGMFADSVTIVGDEVWRYDV